MVVASLGGETFGKAISKVQLNNKKEEDLFKRYSA
jgi:hypothetical protein